MRAISGTVFALCCVFLPGALAAQTTSEPPATDVVIDAPPTGVFIGGTTPSVRPAGAPVITEFVKDPAWYANALHGVSEPYPRSLRWLDDQGGWFTPFTHPGMTGPYDIRGWHTQSN